KSEQHEKEKFDLGLAGAAADFLEQPGDDERQHRDDDDGDDDEQQQIKIVVGEDQAERQHGADIVDEAGGEDDLAELGAVVAGLDHHRVNHRDRGGGERYSGDLRLRPRPAEAVAGEQQATDIGREKAHQAD